MNTRLPLTALLAVAALVAGCGQNRPGASTQLAPTSAYASTQASLASDGQYSTPQNTDFTCAAQPNIKPDYDWNLNGSMYFTVCPGNSSAYKILVHGKTSTNDTICVYPAQYIDSSHVWLKPDQNGFPMYQCAKVTDAGLSLDFELTNFNATFIVEAQDQQQMSSCLIGGNYFNCPKNYSFGTFR